MDVMGIDLRHPSGSNLTSVRHCGLLVAYVEATVRKATFRSALPIFCTAELEVGPVRRSTL
jgi:hypothetical protein